MDLRCTLKQAARRLLVIRTADFRDDAGVAFLGDVYITFDCSESPE